MIALKFLGGQEETNANRVDCIAILSQFYNIITYLYYCDVTFAFNLMLVATKCLFFCRFSLNMDKKETYLYTTHVQAKFTKNSPKLPNYLVSWDMKKCIPKMYVAIKKHVITQFAVR